MLAQWMSSVSMALPSPTIKLELHFFSSTLLFGTLQEMQMTEINLSYHPPLIFTYSSFVQSQAASVERLIMRVSVKENTCYVHSLPFPSVPSPNHLTH